MDQEKYASLNQQSSKPSMQRDTVETLKQIQKKGLSISIVPSGTGSSSTPNTDIRPKSNALPADKTSKVMSVTPRSQTVTENKAQITPTRPASVADTRALPSPRVTAQSAFHDNKSTPSQPRPIQPVVSESKNFSQVRSTPCSSVEKSPATVSRPIITTPVIKMPQNHAVRVLMSDNKTALSRGNQGILNEKTQAHVSVGQRVSQSPQLMENKIQNNQDRVNTTTPSDSKCFSNQGRTGQQFVVSQDNKAIPMQKAATQKAADSKTLNQLSKIDSKTPQINRMIPNIKVMSDVNQNKAKFISVKSDGKPNITGTQPLIVENKMVNSIRMVTNVLEGNTTRTTQCKSSQSHIRIHPKPPGVESSSAVQTKMICTTAVTKMICYHSVPGKSENKVQGGKVIAQTTDMIQKAATVFDMSTEASHVSPMHARIPSAKRPANIIRSPLKKKCIKKSPPASAEMSNKNADTSSGNSPEDGNENEAHIFNNLNNVAGLTITPVLSTATSTPSSSSSAIVVAKPGESFDKELYQMMEHTWKKSAVIKSPRGKSRSSSRRKFIEPVCLTLSSDEENEPHEGHLQVPLNHFDEALTHQMFPQESDGSKSGHSSPNFPDEDNPESDDPQFPGVTDINPKTPEEPYEDEEEEEEEEEEEKEMEMDEIEEEEGSPCEDEEEEIEESEMDEEEIPAEDMEEPMQLSNVPLEMPLLCRSVRIGSYKVHPVSTSKTLNVYLHSDGISFYAPVVLNASKIMPIVVKPSDVTRMLVHFGKCLPILFIFTTEKFAETTRRTLQMYNSSLTRFDPNSNDEKTEKLTFLIDTVTEDQRRFLRQNFLNEVKVREIDQKTANEILVKSTPSNNVPSNSHVGTEIVRCKIAPKPQPEPQTPPQSQPQPLQVSQANLITVTAVQPALSIKLIPPQPAVRLFTYPPPPLTGGIPITTEDVACLNEGEFLNDAIIDFYLKYVFYEKLSEYHREKTHIFSSYFYPRLTHKPERPRQGDDVQKNIQMRRHNQVKTWTRHVDIFSKDFIIIPVNQNVHWFLAIVCYPGLVPEAPPESPVKSDSKTSKSIDNVTSTDDQDENKTSKEANSTADGNSQISDENSTASSNSMFDPEDPDVEEPMPEAPDSSTHPDKNRRRKEVPCICIFDSLNGPNRSRIATMLREYLEVEWKLKKGTRKVFDKNTMQGYIMQCPQQTNYSDCGIYVLQYVESFFENPIPYFDSPIPNLINWFPKEKVAKKRQELKDLILSLQNKTSGNTTNRNSNVSENVPSSQAQVLQTDNR